MLDQVTLRGQDAAIVWGYHTAADVKRWQVQRAGATWQLRAELRRSDAFHLRQSGLKFAAPRVGGYFCWPIVTAPTVVGDRLTAILGPLES